jgi:hypothetical protein
LPKGDIAENRRTSQNPKQGESWSHKWPAQKAHKRDKLKFGTTQGIAKPVPKAIKPPEYAI